MRERIPFMPVLFERKIHLPYYLDGKAILVSSTTHLKHKGAAPTWQESSQGRRIGAKKKERARKA